MTLHTPIWYELLTSDANAAQTFYADVAGWRTEPSGTPGMDYRILHAPDGDGIGGLMRRPEGMPDDPVWLTYVAVADVDAKAQEVVAAGGAVHLPPITLEGVGRIALLADPWGASFYVMAPADSAEPSRAFQSSDAAQPGHAVWNELASPAQDEAIAFYAARFGWRQEGAMPMGDLGDYKFLHAGPVCIGAAMRAIPGAKSGWQPYFLVPDIDEAVRRIAAGGGAVLQGPDQIPGGSYSLVARDPQGAVVGFVGARQ